MTAEDARESRRSMIAEYGLLALELKELEPNVCGYIEATAALCHIGKAAGHLLKLVEILEKGEV